MVANEEANKLAQIDGTARQRRVRAKCPKPECGGDIVDRVRFGGLFVTKRYVGLQCRCCEHVWNVKEIK